MRFVRDGRSEGAVTLMDDIATSTAITNARNLGVFKGLNRAHTR